MERIIVTDEVRALLAELLSISQTRKFLGTPVLINDQEVPAHTAYTVKLPTEYYTNYPYFEFVGALMVWSGGIDITLEGFFEPIKGPSTALQFNAKDLTSASQYATLPDFVFPTFQSGANYNIVKWTPVNPYAFKRLTIKINNNNPTNITILDGVILFNVVV